MSCIAFCGIRTPAMPPSRFGAWLVASWLFLLTASGLPSPSDARCFTTDPRGTGVSAALTGSTLPRSSCTHLRCEDGQHKLHTAHSLHAHLRSSTLRAGFTPAALLRLAKDGNAVHRHGDVGGYVRIGARLRSMIADVHIAVAIAVHSRRIFQMVDTRVHFVLATRAVPGSDGDVVEQFRRKL